MNQGWDKNQTSYTKIQSVFLALKVCSVLQAVSVLPFFFFFLPSTIQQNPMGDAEKLYLKKGLLYLFLLFSEFLFF